MRAIRVVSVVSLNFISLKKFLIVKKIAALKKIRFKTKSVICCQLKLQGVACKNYIIKSLLPSTISPLNFIAKSEFGSSIIVLPLPSK